MINSISTFGIYNRRYRTRGFSPKSQERG